MRVGRVVCALLLSKLTKLALLTGMSRNVSRETTTRMRDNVSQTLTTDDADFSVGSVGSVVKPETRDPSHGPNNSADVSDHGELSLRVRAGIGTTQRRCPHCRRWPSRRCYRNRHQSGYAQSQKR